MSGYVFRLSLGIKFLYGIRIVQGDLKPHNVFVKRDIGYHFVIGSFDSAHDTGSVITFKTRDLRWSRRKRVGKDIAEEDDDRSGFRKLMEWLVGGRAESWKTTKVLGRYESLEGLCTWKKSIAYLQHMSNRVVVRS